MSRSLHIHGAADVCSWSARRVTELCRLSNLLRYMLSHIVCMFVGPYGAGAPCGRQSPTFSLFFVLVRFGKLLFILGFLFLPPTVLPLTGCFEQVFYMKNVRFISYLICYALFTLVHIWYGHGVNFPRHYQKRGPFSLLTPWDLMFRRGGPGSFGLRSVCKRRMSAAARL